MFEVIKYPFAEILVSDSKTDLLEKNWFKINWGYRDVERYFLSIQEMSALVWMFMSEASEP